MEVKAGFKTTEFLLSIIGSLLAVFVAYGVITSEAAATYEPIVNAVIAAVAPLVIGWIGTTYTKSRTEIKTK